MLHKKIPILFFITITNMFFSQKYLDVNFFMERINTSNSSTIIENDYAQKKLQNKLFYKELLPKVSMNISMPYQRSISDVLQPDGTTRYFERNFINATQNLSISQIIPFTGGTVSLSNSINYSRDFNNNINNFSSNWVSISYQQSINGFNSYKWNKKIKRIEFQKDSLDYLKEKSKLKTEIAKIFTEATLSQIKIDITEKNIEKTNNILKEYEEKYRFGRVISSEVEQIKITLEQLKGLKTTNELELESLLEHLLDETNTEIEDSIILKPIEEEIFDINKSDLLMAMDKNGDMLDETLSLLKIDANIEQIKKEGGIKINLNLGMGANSSSQEFNQLYQNPSQSQFATIGANIPIIDWKANKDKIKIAELEKENIKLKIQEDRHHKEEKINEIIKYYWALVHQLSSIKKQIILSDKILTDTNQLLTLGRKTITDYKIQLYENYSLSVELQKIINNLFLIKLQIEEIKLNT